MNIDGVGFGTGGAQAAEAPKTPQDEFLRLLVAQLEHQDPLAPQDSAQFVAQLAQFTQVEQSAETNERLGALQTAEMAGLSTAYSNLVGKEVMAVSNRIGVEDGKVGDAKYSVKLDHAVDSVEIVVRNAEGAEVARWEEGNQLPGELDITWNGLGSSGTQVQDGEYTYEVSVQNADDDEPANAEIRVRGRVTALSFENGIEFTIGAATVDPTYILHIAE